MELEEDEAEDMGMAKEMEMAKDVEEEVNSNLDKLVIQVLIPHSY